MVICVTLINAGDAYNVISDSVQVYGTESTFQPETKREIPSSMLRVTEGVCAACVGTCELKYISGYQAIINSVAEI